MFYYLLQSSFEDYFIDNSLKGTRMVELESKVRKVEFKLLYICRTRYKNDCMSAPPNIREYKGEMSSDTRYQNCKCTAKSRSISKIYS